MTVMGSPLKPIEIKEGVTIFYVLLVQVVT
jgi:hypothetical protein